MIAIEPRLTSNNVPPGDFQTADQSHEGQSPVHVEFAFLSCSASRVASAPLNSSFVNLAATAPRSFRGF